MLKPAYLYSEQLERKFAEVMYDDDFFLYMGYPHGHEIPEIKAADYNYQWAIVDSNNKVIGYFAYNVQPETNTAMNFGLYSFDRGNPLIGHDVFWKMQDLLTIYRRIEWRVVDGNPAMKNYDRFCWKHGGNKVTLHKCMKDCHGIFHDEHIYEIVKENELSLNRR